MLYGIRGLHSSNLLLLQFKLKSYPFPCWRLNAFELDALSSALISLTLTGFWLFNGLVIVRLSGIGATIVTIAVLVIVHSIFLFERIFLKENKLWYTTSIRFIFNNYDLNFFYFYLLDFLGIK